MFKALAEYTLRGRLQAITVILIGSLIPFIPQAVVSLVTLRRGADEGFVLLVCAIVPTIAGFWLGNVPAPLVAASIAVLIVGYMLACLLRTLSNWCYLFVLAAIASMVSAVMLNVFLGDMSAIFRDFYSEAMKGPDNVLSKDAETMISSWTKSSTTAFITALVAYSSVIGVMAGRWWQAMLFNEGGFQKEFHSLRLPMWLAAICSVVMVIGIRGEQDTLIWLSVICLPLLFAGLGLMHWLIARYALGLIAVVALYMALPFGVFAPVILVLAALDSVIDIRQKLRIDQSRD